MARHLDLEEQEQLAELKHFWNRWGNLVSWVLIAVFGSIAAWNGWQYWERGRASQAATLYDEVERAARAGDDARLERSAADMRERFGGTIYAQQAALLAARTAADKGNADAAIASLTWVADNASDDGYKAVARLRLAGLLADKKAYDDAMKRVTGSFPGQFEPLAADRRGDILALQGKPAEAKAEYLKAWQALESGSEYRRLVEVKLSAMGVDPKQGAASAPAPAKS